METNASLPFAALQLLAPPVRLVSAALWKVMKQKDVMQYGVVEEFVTSACETVPGLLTVRHQAKLALGLRGRLILELCSTQPEKKVIMPHLERIRAPAALSPSSASTRKRDSKILSTVEGFHSLVHTLLTDSTRRGQFFKEEFPVDYGPKYDQELEKLLWEFLIRLDQLLPVPSLAQTVSWLSDTPSVLEQCARAATQPQLLKTLLQHQTCLGHLETAASLPPNMGDSILASLSLPPSGKVPSNQPTGAKRSATDQSDGTQTRDKTPFITPVIGLISNEDIPVMLRKHSRVEPEATDEHLHPKETVKFTVVKQRPTPKDHGVKKDEEREEEEEEESKRSCGMKRKQPDERESESDEEEEMLHMTISGNKRISRNLRNGASVLGAERDDQRANESGEDGAVRKEERNGAALETCMIQLGVKTLCLPKDPSLCSIFISCLRSQPRVIIEKLSVTPTCGNGTDGGGTSLYTKLQNQRRASPVKAPTRRNNQPQKLDSPGLDDKENHPVLPSISSSLSQQRSNTGTSARPGDAEDYVADSEDEATKNFKVRLFTKRYYKTKHGTYVPTLREYWKPGMTRRHLSSPGSKRR
ncbi:TERF1-interacting nuclear factor 2 isoform X2 [Cottoperca gobio]|uniref:TERF1-interacting nuclear factor 2 isoform X2 n=1 Tax=Cottoperca gobio TaxID=56716 RepID=A0A6J2RM41_COTGO|nr:TERF1-interacting nuclear factor 2 isoform X2 [Cottoperca gobio]